MNRINVYDETNTTLAGWFDLDKAELIKEDTDWDGNNHVSVHTSDQFDHQCLYRTAGGLWVLNNYSQWQGRKPSYQFIDDEAAKTWLLVNGSDDLVLKYFGEIEDERGPGRPGIGKPVATRFEDDMLARIDARASERGKSRADTIRDLVGLALDLVVSDAVG
jgi:hypothetical protein